MRFIVSNDQLLFDICYDTKKRWHCSAFSECSATPKWKCHSTQVKERAIERDQLESKWLKIVRESQKRSTKLTMSKNDWEVEMFVPDKVMNQDHNVRVLNDNNKQFRWTLNVQPFVMNQWFNRVCTHQFNLNRCLLFTNFAMQLSLKKNRLDCIARAARWHC